MSQDSSTNPPPRPDSKSLRNGGSSAGGLSRESGEREAPAREDDPTVISTGLPLSYPSTEALPARPVTRPQYGDPGELQPGTRLAQFEIEAYVGGGGMGHVYRAIDTTLGRSAAVKVLSSEQASKPETVSRFINEAKSAARLNHQHIAQVFYVGEHEEMPFIAFEYVEGHNIRSLVEQRGTLPLDEAVGYTLQIAHALVHAAERGVIHRDVKPSNVLITDTGTAKLIDMGLARLQQVEEPGEDLTASGVVLGTFDYISPEQALDPRNADARSDIYSLGCTLFYMLTGTPPFPESTGLQKLLKHQGGEPPDIRRYRPDVPEEVARAMYKMMAKDRRHRYQDSADLIEALLGLAEQVGLRPVGPSHTVWVAAKGSRVSWFQRHLPWLAPVAALLVIVLILDQAVWRSPSGGDSGVPGARNGTELAMSLDDRSDTSEQPTDGGATADPNASENTQDTPEAALAADESGSGSTADARKGDPSNSGPAPTEMPVYVDSSNPLAILLQQAGRGDTAINNGSQAALSLGQRQSIGMSRSSTSETVLARLSAEDMVAAEIEPMTVAIESDTGQAVSIKVDPTGRVLDAVTSLADACQLAQGDQLIELCFNGRQEERPFALTNQSLTITAGEGYQPVLVFRPSDIDPIMYPRAMIRLSQSELRLTKLAIELDVPRDIPAEQWSLVELGAAETVTLDGCSLTIRNASGSDSGRLESHHQDVSFFRVQRGMESRTDIEPGISEETHGSKIHLKDCIARGEAVFLRLEDVQPIQLDWTNGLLVTTERLLHADGGEWRYPISDIIQINLDHLTVQAGQGLCYFGHDISTPYQLDTEVSCSNSILYSPNGPIVEQAGVFDPVAARQSIRWSDDRVFYEGVGDYWVITPFEAELPPEFDSFSRWSEQWLPEQWLEGDDPRSFSDQTWWRDLPDDRVSFHSHTPSDYAMDDSGTVINPPAVLSEEDGTPAGCISEDLPDLPREPLPLSWDRSFFGG